jgi:hypothetical protein
MPWVEQQLLHAPIQNSGDVTRFPMDTWVALTRSAFDGKIIFSVATPIMRSFGYHGSLSLADC